MLALAWKFKNMIDMGLDIGLDDIPNIYVLDLLNVIYSQEVRLKKEKHEEMERKAKQAG